MEACKQSDPQISYNCIWNEQLSADMVMSSRFILSLREQPLKIYIRGQQMEDIQLVVCYYSKPKGCTSPLKGGVGYTGHTENVDKKDESISYPT